MKIRSENFQNLQNFQKIITGHHKKPKETNPELTWDKKNILDVLEKFENFHWLGPLQYPGKVREFLTEIDVYALISGIDMAPLTLKEAQLMQKPVIATNVGGIPEMMQDGETGYLIKKGDSNDLIKKLLILLENKELSKQMGQSGREFIENQFSLEASGKNFLNILSSYLDRL